VGTVSVFQAVHAETLQHSKRNRTTCVKSQHSKTTDQRNRTIQAVKTN